MSETLVRPMPGTMPRNGLPDLKPYVYRGTGVDVLTPELGTDEPFAPDAPCWCGEDMRGYRWHLRHGEDACQPSREACNAYHRERRRQRERARQKALSRCGTCGYSVTSRNHKTLCWRPS